MKKITKKAYNDLMFYLTTHNSYLTKKVKYNGYYVIIDDIYIIDEVITNSRIKYELFNEVKNSWVTIDDIYNNCSKDKLIAYDNCIQARLNMEKALNADTIGVVTKGNNFNFSYNALMKIKNNNIYVILVITKDKVKIGAMY